MTGLTKVIIMYALENVVRSPIIKKNEKIPLRKRFLIRSPKRQRVNAQNKIVAAPIGNCNGDHIREPDSKYSKMHRKEKKTILMRKDKSASE